MSKVFVHWCDLTFWFICVVYILLLIWVNFSIFFFLSALSSTLSDYLGSKLGRLMSLCLYYVHGAGVNSWELDDFYRSPLCEYLVCYCKVCRYSCHFAVRELLFYGDMVCFWAIALFVEHAYAAICPISFVECREPVAISCFISFDPRWNFNWRVNVAICLWEIVSISSSTFCFYWLRGVQSLKYLVVEIAIDQIDASETVMYFLTALYSPASFLQFNYFFKEVDGYSCYCGFAIVLIVYGNIALLRSFSSDIEQKITPGLTNLRQILLAYPRFLTDLYTSLFLFICEVYCS